MRRVACWGLGRTGDLDVVPDLTEVLLREPDEDVLGEANPFTEKVSKGTKSLYRARFAGLDKDGAESACKNLRRGEIPCMVLKN